jgi:hypothetical protein
MSEPSVLIGRIEGDVVAFELHQDMKPIYGKPTKHWPYYWASTQFPTGVLAGDVSTTIDLRNVLVKIARKDPTYGEIETTIHMPTARLIGGPRTTATIRKVD